jgi:hypothetical protein
LIDAASSAGVLGPRVSGRPPRRDGHASSLRDHLVTITITTVGVDLLCAIVAFLLERHSAQTEIKTFGSAAFWTTTQLLTVSSSLKNPISGGGRILDVFMEIYAITVIAGLAGAIGTFLQKRGEETKDKR